MSIVLLFHSLQVVFDIIKDGFSQFFELRVQSLPKMVAAEQGGGARMARKRRFIAFFDFFLGDITGKSAIIFTPKSNNSSTSATMLSSVNLLIPSILPI